MHGAKTYCNSSNSDRHLLAGKKVKNDVEWALGQIALKTGLAVAPLRTCVVLSIQLGIVR